MTYVAELRLSRNDFLKIRKENNGVFDEYTLHKIVYSLFPHETDAEGRILYMECKNNSMSAEKKILMVCDRCPQSPPHGQIRSQVLPDGFLNYDRYGFETIVNPVVRDNKTKKIRPIRSTEKETIERWFSEKAAKSLGFSVEPESLAVGKYEVVKFKKGGQDVVFGRVNLLGRLHVTDRSAFVKSFMNGIGRERAFGCGLLRLVPLIEMI